MNIDLSLLHNNIISSIDISGNYTLDESYYQKSDILGLKDIHVEGVITREENEVEDDDFLRCTIDGEMILADSISLEEVNYPFFIEYEDFIPKNCIKNENTLDILNLLWENIVLEVPLQFTKVRDLSKFHGDGWRLISEDERIAEDNPFHDLLKDFEEE